MKLELVPVPVADIDRAKSFYTEQLGFGADHDVRPTDGVRVVQLTPPGSACSILLSAGLPGVEMPTGLLRGLHLVVDDLAAIRAELIGRGVDMSEVQDMGGMLYAYFADPDGNTWALQEMPTGCSSIHKLDMNKQVIGQHLCFHQPSIMSEWG